MKRTSQYKSHKKGNPVCPQKYLRKTLTPAAILISEAKGRSDGMLSTQLDIMMLLLLLGKVLPGEGVVYVVGA